MKTFRNMLRSKTGVVLILGAILFPVMIGFAALAIDLGRLMNLNTQLQKAADSYALSAAAELDGGTDAINRARQAVQKLYSSPNQASFADLPAISTPCIEFLATLPASDDTQISCSDPSSYVVTDLTARFVVIKLSPKSFTAMFAGFILGSANAVLNTDAIAVAGYTRVYCRPTPLFICNGDTTSTNMSLGGGATIGMEIRAKQAPSTSTPSPGNFGYLAVGSRSADALADYIGSITTPNFCVGSTVDTKTGSVTKALQMFNTRFDIYDGSANSSANNADFAPDQNVRKGYLDSNTSASACNMVSNISGNPIPANAASPLPPGIFSTNDIGTAATDSELQAYWTNNFNESLPAALLGKTRFDVYQYEISNGYLDRKSPGLLPSYEGETGRKCNSNSAVSTSGERRMLYAAVIDCSSLSGGTNTDVNVLGIARMFATRPSDGQSIYLEYRGSSRPNSGSELIKDMVKLYR